MPSDANEAPDQQLEIVKQWLIEADAGPKIGRAIRQAIDWVLDGPRTGRYSINDLEPSEKTYIGNRVEHEILYELGLKKVSPLDTHIAGIPVDVKFSLGTAWMIPPEAIDQLCLIVSADDYSSRFNVGLLRTAGQYLGRPNRDGKRGIVKAGRDAIERMWHEDDLPINFLLYLDESIRKAILDLDSGQSRITELFRLVVGTPISTNALDTLAIQRDPSKRARDARIPLLKEGIEVLSGRWRETNPRLRERGMAPIEKDQWISLRMSRQ